MLRSLAPSGGVSIATVVFITAVLVIIASVGVWLVYAYKNPNSRSGMWLIQVSFHCLPLVPLLSPEEFTSKLIYEIHL